MHLRYGGYDFYPSARSGERFEFPSRAATPAVIVHAAWYGVEGGVHTQESRGGEVARTLQRVVEACGGRLALDGDYSRLLGFDPVVGVRKVLAMHITYKGTTYDVRAPEGVPFEHPDLPTGRVTAPAPPMQIVHAWYGLEGGVQESRDGGVVAALRRVLRDNGGRLVLDGDHNRLLGFDPVYGVAKVLAIHVRCDGKDVHLRAPEGQRFEFAPPPVASSAPAAASATNGTTAAGRKRAPPDVCFLSTRHVVLVCVLLLACNCTSPLVEKLFRTDLGVTPKCGGPVEILSARYGLRGDYRQAPDNAGVLARLRENVLASGGCLALDGDLNKLFGFDPAFGVLKHAELNVRLNGQDHQLVLVERECFHFPTPCSSCLRAAPESCSATTILPR